MSSMKNMTLALLLMLIASVTIVYADTDNFIVNFKTINHITVVSPNGGENWIKGTTNTITWSSYGNPGAYVRIELLKGGVKYKTISYLTPNDGSYDWYITSGTGISVGSNYKIRIASISNSKYNDTSDNNFTISNPAPPVSSITVTSPNGGENWIKGTTNTITWSSYGNPGAYVRIELLKSGVRYKTISYLTPNDGSYDWYITSGPRIIAGNNYKVKITSVTNSKYNDTSDNNFTISNPAPPVSSITVTSPNGGETWRRATIRLITWSSVGGIGANVKIELWKGEVLSRTIASSTPNDGYHIWIVPFVQETGNNFKIKITSTNNSSYYDRSDNYFSITT